MLLLLVFPFYNIINAKIKTAIKTITMIADFVILNLLFVLSSLKTPLPLPIPPAPFVCFFSSTNGFSTFFMSIYFYKMNIQILITVI